MGIKGFMLYFYGCARAPRAFQALKGRAVACCGAMVRGSNAAAHRAYRRAPTPAHTSRLFSRLAVKKSLRFLRNGGFYVY